MAVLSAIVLRRGFLGLLVALRGEAIAEEIPKALAFVFAGCSLRGSFGGGSVRRLAAFGGGTIRLLFVEGDRQRQVLAAAENRDLRRVSGLVCLLRGGQIGVGQDLGIAQLRDHIALADAGGCGAAARVHAVYIDAGNAVVIGGILFGHGFDHDAEIRLSGDVAVLDQLIGDLRGIVDGDGKTKPFHAGGLILGGDYADDLTPAVVHRAAGVAAVHRGVQLEHVHAGILLRRNFPVQGADDAGCHGVGQTPPIT